MALYTAIAVGVASLASSIVTAVQAKKRAKKRDEQADDAAARLAIAEETRQEVINPYDQMASLGSMVSNPFASLQVATEAAQFEAEQVDISLANTLDQMKAFGMGGGGATALAQGVLGAKRGISAGIEQQEAKNAQLKAQGEQDAMGLRIGESRRMQAMTTEGRAWTFNTREKREMQQLDRLAGLEVGHRSAANQLHGQSLQIWGQAIPQAIGSAAQTYGASDRRLKKNIKLIGYSPSGLKIYAFKYINKIFGKGIFQGVMSDEIPQHAIIRINGYDIVNYSELDVEFKRI
jgi:hypothetical protein